MLRKKRQIEDFMAQEYDDRNAERLQGRPERFGRSLPGTEMPFGNNQELMEERSGPEPVGYKIIPQRGAVSGGQRDGTKPNTVVMHWTGSQDDTIEGLISSTRDPKRRGYGYDYVVDRDGNIHRMLPPNHYANGIEGPLGRHRTNPDYPDVSNKSTINIGILGDGSDVTKQQMTASQEFLNDIVPGYGISPDRVLGHGDLQGGKGGNKEKDEGVSVAMNFRNNYDPNANKGMQNFVDNIDPFATESELASARMLADRYNSPPATTDVAAAPASTSTQVSSVPAESSGSFRVPTFGELTGISTPLMGKAGGMPAFKSQVTIPQEDMGQSILSSAGQESPFPAPPPPPPRTPPGVQTISQVRRRGRFG